MTLDGDKISNNIKLRPYSEFGSNPANIMYPHYKEESEEVTKKKEGIKDINKHIKHVDILNKYHDYGDDIDEKHPLIAELKKQNIPYKIHN